MINEPPTEQSVSSERSSHPAWKWQDLFFIILGIFIIIFLMIFVVNYAVTSLGGNLLNDLQQTSIWQSLGLAALEAVALVVSVYYFGMRRRSIQWIDLGFKKVTTNWLLAVIGLSVVIIPLSGLITTLVLSLLNQPLDNPQIPFLVPKGLDLGGAIGMLILAGILVPIAEELFFRGVLYNFLRARTGIWLAIIISSLIFAIAHGDLAVGTAAFVLGIVIAWVYEKSGSLWTSILIHAANNSVKIVLLYLFVLLKLVPS